MDTAQRAAVVMWFLGAITCFSFAVEFVPFGAELPTLGWDLAERILPSIVFSGAGVGMALMGYRELVSARHHVNKEWEFHSKLAVLRPARRPLPDLSAPMPAKFLEHTKDQLNQFAAIGLWISAAPDTPQQGDEVKTAFAHSLWKENLYQSHTRARPPTAHPEPLDVLFMMINEGHAHPYSPNLICLDTDRDNDDRHYAKIAEGLSSISKENVKLKRIDEVALDAEGVKRALSFDCQSQSHRWTFERQGRGVCWPIIRKLAGLIQKELHTEEVSWRFAALVDIETSYVVLVRNDQLDQLNNVIGRKLFCWLDEVDEHTR